MLEGQILTAYASTRDSGPLKYPHVTLTWNGRTANVPFMLRVTLPKSDQGKRGYSAKMVSSYQKIFSSE